jgi:hypothetical protein
MEAGVTAIRAVIKYFVMNDVAQIEVHVFGDFNKHGRTPVADLVQA